MVKITQNKTHLKVVLVAGSRAEVIERFTQWVNDFPYDDDIRLWIDGIIGDKQVVLDDNNQ